MWRFKQRQVKAGVSFGEGLSQGNVLAETMQVNGFPILGERSVNAPRDFTEDVRMEIFLIPRDVDVVEAFGCGREPQFNRFVFETTSEFQFSWVIVVVVFAVDDFGVAEGDVGEFPVVSPVGGDVEGAEAGSVVDPEEGVAEEEAPVVVEDAPEPVVPKHVVFAGEPDPTGEVSMVVGQPPQGEFEVGGEGLADAAEALEWVFVRPVAVGVFQVAFAVDLLCLSIECQCPVQGEVRIKTIPEMVETHWEIAVRGVLGRPVREGFGGHVDVGEEAAVRFMVVDVVVWIESGEGVAFVVEVDGVFCGGQFGEGVVEDAFVEEFSCGHVEEDVLVEAGGWFVGDGVAGHEVVEVVVVVGGEEQFVGPPFFLDGEVVAFVLGCPRVCWLLGFHRASIVFDLVWWTCLQLNITFINFGFGLFYLKVNRE